VLIMHGTGGTGAQFLAPYFAGVLFGPGTVAGCGEVLHRAARMTSARGSSKPSDGMHAHFPHYDYDDMVAAEHLLLPRGCTSIICG